MQMNYITNTQISLYRIVNTHAYLDNNVAETFIISKEFFHYFKNAMNLFRCGLFFFYHMEIADLSDRILCFRSRIGSEYNFKLQGRTETIVLKTDC